MDNNTLTASCEDLKSRIEILKNKCSTAQGNLEKKVREISSIDKDIGQMERELCEYKSKTNTLQELRMNAEVEIDKLRWTQEKASIVLEGNRRISTLQYKMMEAVRRNHINLTTSAFKTVRQEAVRQIINSEINNLSYRKNELENQLRQLRNATTRYENDYTRASAELMQSKIRVDAISRLEKKLEESEAFRLNVINKLNNLKKTHL